MSGRKQNQCGSEMLRVREIVIMKAQRSHKKTTVRSTLALRAQQHQNHHRSPLPQPHQPCDLARIVIALSRSCPSYCTCNCSLCFCVFVVSPSCIFKDSTLSASNVTISPLFSKLLARFSCKRRPVHRTRADSVRSHALSLYRLEA